MIVVGVSLLLSPLAGVLGLAVGALLLAAGVSILLVGVVMLLAGVLTFVTGALLLVFSRTSPDAEVTSRRGTEAVAVKPTDRILSEE